MPHYKCMGCHYEFDYTKTYKTDDNPLCNWCGAPSTILEKETSFDKFCKGLTRRGFQIVIEKNRRKNV